MINLQELPSFLRKVMRSNLVLTFCWININIVPLGSGFKCPNCLWLQLEEACCFEQGGAWSYHEQLTNCTGFGASLISIHNGVENDLISLVNLQNNQSYFIGLKRENCEAEWEWADGTPLDFTYWSKGKHQND